MICMDDNFASPEKQERGVWKRKSDKSLILDDAGKVDGTDVWKKQNNQVIQQERRVNAWQGQESKWFQEKRVIEKGKGEDNFCCHCCCCCSRRPIDWYSLTHGRKRHFPNKTVWTWEWSPRKKERRLEGRRKQVMDRKEKIHLFTRYSLYVHGVVAGNASYPSSLGGVNQPTK